MAINGSSVALQGNPGWEEDSDVADGDISDGVDVADETDAISPISPVNTNAAQ